MKAQYLGLTSVLLPNIVLALTWSLNERVILAGLTAVGIACGIGSSVPNCAIVAGVAIFSTIFSALFNNGGTTGTVGTTGDLESGAAPPGIQKRHSYPVKHYHADGSVYDYLNTSALEVGVWHTVQSGEHILRASKHAEGFNILQMDLKANGIVARATDENAIDTVSAQFGDGNLPSKDTWTDDDLNNLSNGLWQSEGPYTARSLCTTVSNDSDDDTFDISFVFGTPNVPIPDPLPAACAA
nr:hypothetical protein CFP56_65492 [Quercus suber]